MDQQVGKKKKDKTERVIGSGRRTREETVKWNQMTALRFQTGGEISDILGLPSEASSKRKSILVINMIVTMYSKR